MPARIGMLGGTFDPIHRGHLHMARAAQRACRLQRVYFVPANHPWHKALPEAGYPDRYAMVALALARHPNWEPLHIPDPVATPPGIANPATYSVDQVAWLRRRHPGQTIVFIVGADAFATLPDWHHPERLLRLCDFIVLGRAGTGHRDVVAALPRKLVVAASRHRIELKSGRMITLLPDFSDRSSSTDIRNQIAGSRRQRLQVLPAAVDAYIRRARLY